ncbi:hypothetical protein [Gracilimonas sp. BCB1]|uniref:hypothetical protein n=1 Tax=Gracilimonas sp. BCB1 TaxID=3152362 RepID=UPI0032D90E7D
MDNRTMNIFKKHISLLLLLLISGALISCDTIISQISELPENEDEEASNSNDPTDPSYTLPGIRFTNGSFSLDNPFEVTQREITLDWDVVDANGSTIEFDFEYSYRYASPEESIQSKSFQPVSGSESITISNLNETFGGELYTFEIYAQYPVPNSSAVKDTTFEGQFSVNAIQSRGFLFNPYIINSNNDGTYTAEIYLDEIQETDDLTAFSLVLSYSNTLLSVTDVQVFGQAGSFLNPDGSNTLIYVEPEITSGLITIEAGIAGNTASISGGGAVCEITFAPTGSFQGNTSLSIHNSSVLKSSQGFDIDILQFDQADVVQ